MRRSIRFNADRRRVIRSSSRVGRAAVSSIRSKAVCRRVSRASRSREVRSVIRRRPIRRDIGEREFKGHCMADRVMPRYRISPHFRCSSRSMIW